MKTFTPVSRIILIIACIIAFQSNSKLLCQQFEYAPQPVQGQPFYVGLGLGINDYGFGLNLEAPVRNGFSINGNAGIGGWGWKLGGSMNYYPVDNYRHELSMGYSYASGFRDFKTDLTVEPYGDEQTVTLDLYGVSTINVMYTLNLMVGRSSKIGLSGGYAICLTRDAYRVNGLVELDQTSKLIMDIMQPGGLILGIKLMIGGL